MQAFFVEFFGPPTLLPMLGQLTLKLAPNVVGHSQKKLNTDTSLGLLRPTIATNLRM